MGCRDDRDRSRWGGVARGTRTGAVVLAVLLGMLVGTGGTARAFSPAEIYRSAAGSVVLIFGFDDGGTGASGTGSILTRDGLVLTNHHVIVAGESGRLYPNLVVYFKPQPISGDNRKDLTSPYLVEVVARDPELDLALLRVKDAPADLRPLEIGDSEEVDIGEPVAAIGHPGGGGLWTLTTGTVSSKRRDGQRDIFQTDTAINPGNSGGPLLDEQARLVGVNTFVRRVNDQGLPLEGLNYSLRSSVALAWVNRQGVARLAAVSRADDGSSVAGRSAAGPDRTIESAGGPEPAPDPAPEPAPEPETPRAATPTPEAATPPQAEPDASDRPEPPRAEPGPRASAPDGPAPDESAPAGPDPGAREFTGPDGETFYGVPNPEAELHETLRHAREDYRELTERADESVREMERLFEDYDNF